MATSRKTRQNAKKTSAQNAFMWTDDEVELLLTVTNEYKVSKTYESVDWESVESKYADILERFKQHIPSTGDNSESFASGKDFPHKANDITKSILSTKQNLLAPSLDNQSIVARGVVMGEWFGFTMNLIMWGGSPATASIETGIESTEIESPSIDKVNESSDCDEVNTRRSVQQSLTANDDCSSVSLESESTTATHSESSHEVEVKARSERRALINEKLKNHKQEKLKRKLPLDSQLLSIAQDEMKVKKQLLDKLDCMDQQYSDTMKSLSSNIEKLTNCITDVCSVFKTEFYDTTALHVTSGTCISSHGISPPTTKTTTVKQQH